MELLLFRKYRRLPTVAALLLHTLISDKVINVADALLPLIDSFGHDDAAIAPSMEGTFYADWLYEEPDGSGMDSSPFCNGRGYVYNIYPNGNYFCRCEIGWHGRKCELRQTDWAPFRKCSANSDCDKGLECGILTDPDTGRKIDGNVQRCVCSFPSRKDVCDSYGGYSRGVYSIACNNGKGDCSGCTPDSTAPECSCNGPITNRYTGKRVQCTDMSPDEADLLQEKQGYVSKLCKQVGSADPFATADTDACIFYNYRPLGKIGFGSCPDGEFWNARLQECARVVSLTKAPAAPCKKEFGASTSSLQDCIMVGDTKMCLQDETRLCCSDAEGNCCRKANNKGTCSAQSGGAAKNGFCCISR